MIIIISTLFTVLAPIIVGIGFEINESLPITSSFFGMLLIIFFSIDLMIMYIISLVGLGMKMSSTYHIGVATLIMGMFWTPIGTIVNAVSLGKLNNPDIKKYLCNRD